MTQANLVLLLWLCLAADFLLWVLLHLLWTENLWEVVEWVFLQVACSPCDQRQSSEGNTSTNSNPWPDKHAFFVHCQTADGRVFARITLTVCTQLF